MQRKRNKTQKALIIAFKKGYRVVNGELYYNDKKRGASLDCHGYLFFTIRNELGERWPVPIHRLVGYQKYGKKIFKKGMHVRHYDGVKLNNLESNILVGSASDNHMDKSPEVRMRAALAATDAIRKHNHIEILKLHEQGYSYKKIMKALGIKSKGAISYIVKKSMEANKQNGSVA